VASFLKALLVVGVVLVLLAIVAGVAGYWWYTKHGREFMEAARQAHAEGVQFGEETDDEGCLHEALARHKQAGGLAQSISHNLFLKGCLSSSEQTEGFCDGVPKRLQIVASMTWQTKRCAGAGFTDPTCRQLFAQVQEYCESDISRPEDDRERIKKHARG
jgi:hypothetical protein